MHLKYHTDAFVVRSFERGEADRVYVLLTKEMGKVYAHAKSIRRLNSKNRFGLQVFSRSSVSLVRGKSGMRIVHVSPQKNIYRELAPYSQSLSVFRNIVTLAERLTPQDEAADEVFGILEATTQVLQEGVDPDYATAVEAGAALGILYALGYVQHQSPFSDIAEGALVMDSDYLRSVARKRSSIVREINRALQASQL